MKGLQIKNGKIILSAYQADKAVDYGSNMPEASTQEKAILKTMQRLTAIRKRKKLKLKDQL